MMINIVIPMAGLGSRFSKAGYSNPKPFIDVNGLPMVERVLENLLVDNCRFILIARSEHVAEFHALFAVLKKKYNIEILELDGTTEGTACTVLKARKFINNESQLVVANCDQLIDMNFNDFLIDAEYRNLDGSILTFVDPDKNPKWSFARLDSAGIVVEVKEKVAISKYATVGIYYFKQGSYFVDGAIDMIVNKDRVNDEFYTCPVYNYLIVNDMKIGIYDIQINDMHGLGTPADLTKYLSSL